MNNDKYFAKSTLAELQAAFKLGYESYPNRESRDNTPSNLNRDEREQFAKGWLAAWRNDI